MAFSDFRPKQRRTQQILSRLLPLNLENGNQGEIKTHSIFPPPKQGHGQVLVNKYQSCFIYSLVLGFLC